MENDDAIKIILQAIRAKCFQECEPEWDNCRHLEADHWFVLLLKQVGIRADL